MSEIIACIDDSTYVDNVCNLSAWVAGRTGLVISLLHVVAPHSDVPVKGNLSGSIGFDANSDLLKELTEIDEAHGKMEQKKGELMLGHAKKALTIKGITHLQTLQRRGSLVEALVELGGALIVMGRGGEKTNVTLDHLGSNLERVMRAIHTPLLVATKTDKPISRFLVAYDGSPSAQKAIEYLVSNPLLKGLECHLLKVGEKSDKAEAVLKQAEDKMKSAGFIVHVTFTLGKPVDDIIAAYITTRSINLLVMGAYGHSKIRRLIFGSTTTSLIYKSEIPVLLFR
ncbi:MAG: universal stress protein [Candidatus Berkiella sp.]